MAPFEPLPACFLTSGKTTRSLICPTTYFPSPWGSIPAFSCPKCQLHGCWSTPGTVSNASNASKSSLLEPTSKHQSNCFLEVVWKRPASSPVPLYACPHDLLHNMHIQGKQHRWIVVKKRCCRLWEPMAPFEPLPACFLTTLHQFPATASFAMPVSDFM